MADEKKTTTDPEKSLDLPPYGSRNPDPITDTPGAHPVEVGLGAALGGAASGAAIGLVAGPVGAAIGAVVGAVAGGYAGKGVGELIDPTTEDNWLRESFTDKHYVEKGETFEKYAPAYKHGATLTADAKYAGKPFHEVEHHLKSEWETTHAPATGLGWDKAKHAVKEGMDRTIQLREERLKVNKETVNTGSVGVRKEVHTEHKTVTVPVEREELVIERRAVAGTATHGEIKAEEIRIPLKEEQVHVTKEAVVKEEVSVGTRKVQGTETVSGEVRKEELIVDNKGDVKVHDTKK